MILTLNWNYVCRSMTYTCISWSSDFALYLEDYLMDKCHNCDIGSMWCKDLLSLNVCGSVTYISWSSEFVISWRLFDELMFSVTQTLNWNYISRSVTYISWYSDFILYLEGYLMDKRNWNIGSMWRKYLPHTTCVGQWPTFHCPVILSYILKTFWWRNVVLKIPIVDSVRH